MIDDALAARLMELLDRRQRGTLTAEESRELDASTVIKDPIGETIDRADPIGETIDRAVDHFDFDRARHALDQRLRADRTTVRMGGALISLVILSAAAMAWWRGDWGMLIFTASAQALVPLGWMLLTARRRRSARAALAGRLPVNDALVEHRRASARELVVMQTTVILAFISFAVLVLEGALNGHWLRVIVGIVMLVIVLPPAATRVFSALGKQRRRNFIEGRSSASAWLRGSDGSQA